MGNRIIGRVKDLFCGYAESKSSKTAHNQSDIEPPLDRQERKVLCSGIAILIQAALADRMFDWLENPAIAAKCQRMVLKRVNSKWESTRIPSSCSIINNPEEEAVKVCKEVTNREKQFRSNFSATIGFSYAVCNWCASNWTRNVGRSVVQFESPRLGEAMSQCWVFIRFEN